MHILVAEDNISYGQLIKKFLEGLGYEVATASDGQDLIRLAMEKKPDLIITDLHMPNMSGDTMISMINHHPDLCETPIIIVTGISKQEVEEMALNSNIPLLYKPVDFNKLAKELERLIKERKL